MIFKRVAHLVLTAGLVAAAVPAVAACRVDPAGFPRFLAEMGRQAVAAGVSQRTVDSALSGLTFDPSIISKDRGQGVFGQPFLQFSDRMAAAHRINGGKAKISQYRGVFARAEQQYGVPAAVIASFWGLETDFGANSGNLSTLRSIATLAYDCRRPELFRPQLIDALKIIDRGDLTPGEMVGAWAGELGQMQFMASDYYKYAVDGDGDGRRNLIKSAPDAIMSAANFMASLGWQRGQPWLQEVRVPASLPWEQADPAVMRPVSQWAQWGVTLPSGAALTGGGQASLLLPMGRLGPAFLAYPNYQVFLKWNQSFVYATTAAYLATRIDGAGPVGRGAGSPPIMSPKEIQSLQVALQRAGFNPGDADGKIGTNTRTAIRAAQLKVGLPADGWPTPDLAARLR